MRINEPLTPEQHAQADAEHRERTERIRGLLDGLAQKVESGDPLDSLERKRAASAIRGFAKSIPLERKRSPGRPHKVPEEAILLRQVYINGGDSVARAEERLAELYGVDLETLQSRIKRLAKAVTPEHWGFEKWGAN